MEHATAADLIYLQLRTGAPLPEGALPASLEYLGPHGRINYFLIAAPGSALCARPEAAALAPLESLKLYENEDGSWKLCLRGQDMDADAVEYPMEADEVAALLQKNGVGMPGRAQQPPAAPSPAQAAPADADAPPF